MLCLSLGELIGPILYLSLDKFIRNSNEFKLRNCEMSRQGFHVLREPDENGSTYWSWWIPSVYTHGYTSSCSSKHWSDLLAWCCIQLLASLRLFLSDVIGKLLISGEWRRTRWRSIVYAPNDKSSRNKRRFLNEMEWILIKLWKATLALSASTAA